MTSLPPSGLWAGETLALGVGMKEGRKCGGRDGAGRRWQGGTASQRWLLAPAPLGQLRPEGLEQLLGLEVRCGGPSLARGRGAGGNCIPGDGVGDLQLGGTGNESGLLTGRLQTLGS